MPKIYTKTGDDGTTGLGGGQRVGKDSLRIGAYGTVDELNSVIGAALAEGLYPLTQEVLRVTQNSLFTLGADLALPESDARKATAPRIEEVHVHLLELFIDDLDEQVPPLENFILPGGSSGAALLHVARTVCRRAERLVVTLSKEEPVSPFDVKYLNRLSDALFVLARYENFRTGAVETIWDGKTT